MFDAQAEILSEKFTDYLDDIFMKHMIMCNEKVQYTLADLDKQINSDETLREYILDSEREFGLPHKEDLSDDNINAYIAFLDSKWEV